MSSTPTPEEPEFDPALMDVIKALGPDARNYDFEPHDGSQDAALPRYPVPYDQEVPEASVGDVSERPLWGLTKVDTFLIKTGSISLVSAVELQRVLGDNFASTVGFLIGALATANFVGKKVAEKFAGPFPG